MQTFCYKRLFIALAGALSPKNVIDAVQGEGNLNQTGSLQRNKSINQSPFFMRPNVGTDFLTNIKLIIKSSQIRHNFIITS